MGELVLNGEFQLVNGGFEQSFDVKVTGVVGSGGAEFEGCLDLC
jgi:hypothetical protein